MCDVTGHNNSALQIDTGRDRILTEFLTNSIDTLIQVDGDGVSTLASLSILGRNEL